MLGANAYIPIRDYSISSIPPEGALEPRVVKLSEGTFAIGKKTFLKSGNFTVAKKENNPVVAKRVSFEELSATEKQNIEKKADRIGKIIVFPKDNIRSSLKGEKKTAKLGEAFIGKISVNGLLCQEVLSMKKAKVESVPVALGSTAPLDNTEDVVIHFDPEQIKERVNHSFDTATNMNERIEFTPLPEYSVNIPEEEEEVARLPHAERSAKLNMNDMEREDKIISLSDYLEQSNLNTSIEGKNTNATDRTSVLSVDEMIRGGRVDSMRDGKYLMDDYNEENSNVDIDDGVELLKRELEEVKSRAEEARIAAEQARKEQHQADEAVRESKAREKAKEEAKAKALKESEEVGKQREKTQQNYETTVDATKRQLEAEKTRIMNKVKTYQKEYQRATEEANKLWSERVATEERIDAIDTEIPTIKFQTEADREAMEAIRERTKQIRAMANEITGLDNVNEQSDNHIGTIKKNSMDSIFDGTAPIDFSSIEQTNSYSKGKVA